MLRRVRAWEQENEILRQTTAYLSQANLKAGQARPKGCIRWSVALWRLCSQQPIF
jgi:hypothetical protein